MTSNNALAARADRRHSGCQAYRAFPLRGRVGGAANRSRRSADGRYAIAQEIVETGEMPGVLLHEPHGEHGFGYDPLFVPDDQPARAVEAGEKLTSAQMEPAEKNAISHRGKALRACCHPWPLC